MTTVKCNDTKAKGILNEECGKELKSLMKDITEHIAKKLSKISGEVKKNYHPIELLVIVMSTCTSQIIQQSLIPSDPTLRLEIFRDFIGAIQELSEKMFFITEALHLEAKGKIN